MLCFAATRACVAARPAPALLWQRAVLQVIAGPLSLCKVLLINERQFDGSVRVDADRAPVAGHAWWSGGPLFDVKTGKVMVCAATMLHPVGFMQSACS